MSDDDAVALAHDLISAHADLQVRLLRSEQLNAELARMLTSVEWSSADDSSGYCPECIASKRSDHYPDCALAALLKKARTG
jgi:hypothetical protein